jgi:hypothetical protein
MRLKMELNLKSPRKIMDFKYSRMICLPLAWLKHHNLKSGDLVDFTIGSNGELIVKPIKEALNEKTIP